MGTCGCVGILSLLFQTPIAGVINENLKGEDYHAKMGILFNRDLQ